MNDGNKPKTRRIVPELKACLAMGWLLGCLALPTLGEAETISRIKLVIDDQTYLWEAGQARPARLEGQFQDPAFALSLAGVVPGQTIGHAELETRIIDAKRLLDRSKLFNDAQVFFLASRDDPEVGSLFIMLRTGFSLRFGGGLAYAMVGNDNVDGQLLNWRALVGFNRAGASVGQGLRDLSPWYWQANALYQNNGLEPSVNAAWIHSPSLELQVGTAGYPWYAHLSAKGRGDIDQFGASVWSLEASPELGVEKTWSFDYLDADGAIAKPANAITAGLSVNASFAWLLPESQFRSHLGGRAFARAQLGILTIASQVYGVWSPEAVPDRFTLDFKGTDDRSVRGNYADALSLVDHGIMSNSELRLRAASFKLGIISEIDIDPFLFYDAAWFGRTKQAGAPLFTDAASAFGLGLRILMGSPVNTDFSFGLGLTPESFKPAPGAFPLRFTMTVTSGF